MGTVEYDVYQNLKKLIEIRKKLPYLHGQTTQYALDLHNQNVLGIIRQIKTQTFFALFNFSEQTQWIKTDHLRQLFNGMIAIDLVQGRIFNLDEEMIELSPYEYVWCINQKNPKK
jgi:hypothetical protein